MLILSMGEYRYKSILIFLEYIQYTYITSIPSCMLIVIARMANALHVKLA